MCSPIAVFSQSRTGSTRSQSDINLDLVYLCVYMAILNDLGDKKLVSFRNAYGHKHEAA
jgi:hypothetical protein